MMLDTSKVSFSNNDIRFNIKIPRTLNSDLAYLLGMQCGDGCLKKARRGTTVDYIICYDGHKENDRELFSQILRKIILKLFNKLAPVSITRAKTINIKFCSKAIFTFLNRSCGIRESPKTDIVVPDVILKSSLRIKRAYIRGLADADFSLTFKRRIKTTPYPVIYFQTSCQSLYQSTKNLLIELGFHPTGNYRKNKRYDKTYDAYYLQISGRNQLDKWMRDVGSFSSNHLSRYNAWKKIVRENYINRLLAR